MARTTRTRRGVGEAADQAGQNALPVYICNTCGGNVCWATSKRTGRKYLVNVRTGPQVQSYKTNDLHTQCSALRTAQAQAQAEGAALAATRRGLSPRAEGTLAAMAARLEEKVGPRPSASDKANDVDGHDEKAERRQRRITQASVAYDNGNIDYALYQNLIRAAEQDPDQ